MYSYLDLGKIGWLLLILSTMAPYAIFMAFTFKEYGSIYIEDDHYLSLLGSIGSAANGIFRLIIGATLDYLSFKKIMLVIVAIFMVSCGTIVFSVKNEISYFITIVLSYGCEGSLFSLFPTQTVYILGK